MSLHRCDGPELPALLVQVQRDFGPHVTVVSAEKVRRGGVGGFFAREWFELTVETPDGDDPASLLDRAIDDTEDVLDLFTVGDMEDELRARSTQGADLPSTERREFADVLASVAGVTARPAAPRPRMPEPVIAPEPARSVRKPSWRRMSARDEADVMPQPAVVTPPRAARPVVTEPAPAPRVMKEPVVTEPVRGEPVLVERALTDSLSRGEAMTALGLPPVLIAAIRDLPPANWAESIARALPEQPPLPRLAGSVVAVIGTKEIAMEQAVELSKRMAVPVDSLYVAARSAALCEVAAGFHLPDGAAVRERSRRFVRATYPTVVAVVLDGERGATRWLTEVMRELTPDQTWLSARAGARLEDVRAMVSMIGGADVLTLTESEATSSPGALLALGVPVAKVDGLPVSPRRWAAMIADRLEGGEEADRLAAAVVGAVPSRRTSTVAAGPDPTSRAPTRSDRQAGVVVPILGSTDAVDQAQSHPAYSRLRRGASA